jgi:hypothetical protein
MWERDVGAYPVDFERQGDEWTYHLAVELTGNGFITARGTDGTDPVEIGPPSSGPLTSRLHVRPHEGGLTCTVVGDGDVAADDQVEPWRRAAESAVASLGRRNHDFGWETIVGTDPHMLGPDHNGCLKEARNLGPIILTPAGVCMREYVAPRELIDQQGFGIRHSFPIIAAGRINTYDWQRAVPMAQRVLRHTCALLSLCTDELWMPRSQLRQLYDGAEGLHVPATVGPETLAADFLRESEWTGEIPPGTPTFDLPKWIDQAWQSLIADPGLATAVNAHYEAMRLHWEHPSLAHLTYVAAIEGFGARFAKPVTCDCCPDCTCEKGVAVKRFRKALKTVMTNREVKQLADLTYDLRSRTGHEGRLFGSEETFGYSEMSLFFAAIDVVFDYSVLRTLRHASRNVLLKALKPDTE